MALTAPMKQLLEDYVGGGFLPGPRSPLDFVLKVSPRLLSSGVATALYFSLFGYRKVIDATVHKQSPPVLTLPSMALSILNDGFGAPSDSVAAQVGGGVGSEATDADPVDLDQFRAGQLTTGAFLLGNPDGDLDTIVTLYGWGDAPALLYVVGMEDAWTTAEVFFPFTIRGEPGGDLSEITLETKGALANPNRPAQTDTFANGETKPLTLGRCFNVEPYLEDSANLRYTVDGDGGAIEEIVEGYENGFPIGSTLTEDLANSQFDLASQPTGKITADVKGQKFDGGAYAETQGKVFERLLDRLSLTGVVNTTDRDALTDVVGVFVGPRSSPRLADLLAYAVKPAAVFYPAMDGSEFRLLTVIDPSGETATESFREDEQDIESIEFRPGPPPAFKVRIGYARNGVVLSAPLTEVASEVERLTNEFSWKEAEDATILNNYPNAVFYSIPSPLAVAATAATAATTALALWKVQRNIYRIDLTHKLFHAWVGDYVTLQHSRYGLSAGKVCLVVGIDVSLDDNPSVTLELWG